MEATRMDPNIITQVLIPVLDQYQTFAIPTWYQYYYYFNEISVGLDPKYHKNHIFFIDIVWVWVLIL